MAENWPISQQYLGKRSATQPNRPAGVYAGRTFGDLLTPLLGAVVVLWIALPLAIAVVAFTRKGSV